MRGGRARPLRWKTRRRLPFVSRRACKSPPSIEESEGLAASGSRADGVTRPRHHPTLQIPAAHSPTIAGQRNAALGSCMAADFSIAVIIAAATNDMKSCKSTRSQSAVVHGMDGLKSQHVTRLPRMDAPIKTIRQQQLAMQATVAFLASPTADF